MSEIPFENTLIRVMAFLIAGVGAAVAGWTGNTILDNVSATEAHEIRIERLERDIERLERRVSQ
ncbi:MAG: hypothetical protein AAGF27_06690 [Pseudomonadota bacterium]